MFDAMAVNDDIELVAENAIAGMPASIKRVAELARRDLISGPVYLGCDGDEASCFDENVTPFDFSGACDTLQIRADASIFDDEVEIAYNEETGDSHFEPVDGSREMIIKKVFGSNLSAYI
jgi:hypothetical protein